MTHAHRRFVVSALLLLATATGVWSQTPAGWLDRPLSRWNQTGAALPTAPVPGETRDALVRRCSFSAADVGPAGDAMAKTAWVPFLHVDRRIVRDDVEIIGGMSAATSSCEPAAFNLFVFVGGRFSGTLSPVQMTSRTDGAVGSVRITAIDTLTAEFARYTSTDPDCCPSSHVRVTYRIDRTGTRPVLVAVDARQIRG